MKKIEAIIQPFRFDAVKQELARAGIEGMTITEVTGHGRQHGKQMVYRGREYDSDLLPKLKIEIVVHDADAERVIAAICTGARTGRIGDGKIFIYEAPEVIRIRNDQRNEAAL